MIGRLRAVLGHVTLVWSLEPLRLALPVVDRLRVLAWLFLRLGAEGELRRRLLEQGLDARSVARAVRYGRGKELAH